MTLRNLLESTARRAVHYLETLDDRGVAPTAQALHNLSRLHESFPEHPTDPTEVLALLDEVGSPATVALEGTCWASGSVWHGHSVMRISVSSWATTESDVERSLEAIPRVAARHTDGV